MIGRRGFLGVLAGAVLDPERALWVPGKLISIPSGRQFAPRMNVHHALQSRRLTGSAGGENTSEPA